MCMQKDIQKRLSVWAALVAAVLMIPLVGRFPWTIGDYVFACVVLFGAATAYELTTKNMANRNHRLLVGAAAVVMVMLIWVWAVA